MEQWPTLEQVEKKHILETLARCMYNYTTTAKALGVPRSTLYRKANAYDELKALKQQRDITGMGDLFR